MAENDEGLEVMVGGSDDPKDESKGLEELIAEDPMMNEGKKAPVDDKERIIQKQNKKIDYFYGKMKENEEKAIEFQKKLDEMGEALSTIDQLKEHNRLLAEAIRRQNTPMGDTGVDTKEIDNKIAELKAEKKKAREDFDYSRADDLQDEIDELKEKKRNVMIKPKENTENIKNIPDVDPELIRAFDTFKSENTWFNKNEKMRNYAIGVDNMLINDPDWDNKSYKERFDEVKRMTEKRFGVGQSKDTGVEEGNRSGGGKGKKITLTKEQVAIASKLGLSPEEYASQLAIIQGVK